MVEGEVHYYEFVVSTYHIIYSCLFICTDYNSIRVRLDGGVEKWEDRKYLVFLHVCLVGGVEKWEGGKLFCLVGEKKGRMENVIYIN